MFIHILETDTLATYFFEWPGKGLQNTLTNVLKKTFDKIKNFTREEEFISQKRIKWKF